MQPGGFPGAGSCLQLLGGLPTAAAPTWPPPPHELDKRHPGDGAEFEDPAEAGEEFPPATLKQGDDASYITGSCHNDNDRSRCQEKSSLRWNEI